MRTLRKISVDMESIQNIWTFGPPLLQKGEIEPGLDTSTRSPRTAIGFHEPGHYCLLVADGRQQGYAPGLSMSDLAEILLEEGCVVGYNLDGGQSSIMIFEDTVVNRPYKNGRDITNMLIFVDSSVR